jgi:hypothetical protein
LLPQAVTLDKGIEAVPLGNAAELAEEGQRMQHCVGGYWRHCFLGESHIVSLRKPNGESLSTLEIRIPVNGVRQCNIAQHRARRNQNPARELLRLESSLCAQVLQLADFKALNKWRQGAAKIDATTHRYDFNDERFERLVGVLGRNRLLGLFEA